MMAELLILLITFPLIRGLLSQRERTDSQNTLSESGQGKKLGFNMQQAHPPSL
jgi:hypothetical protein